MEIFSMVLNLWHGEFYTMFQMQKYLVFYGLVVNSSVGYFVAYWQKGMRRLKDRYCDESDPMYAGSL